MHASAGPRWPVLLGLLGLVLLLHLLVGWGLGSIPLQLRLPTAPPPPVQLRVLPMPVAATPQDAPRSVHARPSRRPMAAQAVQVPAEPPIAALPTAESPMTVAAASDSAPEAASAATSASVASAQEPPASAAGDMRDQEPTPWPLVPLGAMPPSQRLHYHLTGMDKGFNYHAQGELQWQHNASAYALTLTVKAFLLGSRQWHSQGRVSAAGLEPRRFADLGRGERAAHFDREARRVVFSGNSPVAELQPGAQDQISLYVQLAAAMAGEPERFVAGTRLQVQTITVREAQPWLLRLQGHETLELEGLTRPVVHWVFQPTNRFEAQVDLWLDPRQDWLPARILITQRSGSYIDLRWRSSEPMPPLPE